MDGEGIFQELQARAASVQETARKRGMSEAALARLPRPAIVKRETLPPVVLATGDKHRSPELLERARASARAAAARRAETRPLLKRRRPARMHLTNGRLEGGADHKLFQQLVDIAATESGYTAYQIHDFKRERKIVLVRHICWRLLREFTGLSSCSIARIIKRGCHSSVINGIARALVTTTTTAGATLYWTLRTRLSAAGHVVVDDLENRKRGRS